MEKQFEMIVQKWYNLRIKAERNQLNRLNRAFRNELSKIGYAYCQEQSTSESNIFKNLPTGKVVVAWNIGDKCTGESYYVPGILGHHAISGKELKFDYAK